MGQVYSHRGCAWLVRLRHSFGQQLMDQWIWQYRWPIFRGFERLRMYWASNVELLQFLRTLLNRRRTNLDVDPVWVSGKVPQPRCSAYQLAQS